MASTSVGARSSGFGRQVLLVGGIGRMETQYRALVESRGFELIYRERKITGGTPPATLAAILVVTTVVSHPLREHAARLAGACRVPIVYLRAPSLSAVRKALDEALGQGLGQGQEAHI